MESLIALLVLVIIILIVCLNESFKNKYLNKGWANKNSIVEPPVFRIEKIERTCGCNGYWVGKYTAECWYRTKRSVDYSTFVFYDDINKYNVGDKLVLTPEIEKD